MGREPVRSDAIPLTLFQHDAVNAHSERSVQGHVGAKRNRRWPGPRCGASRVFSHR